jgi:hypothetical protein
VPAAVNGQPLDRRQNKMFSIEPGQGVGLVTQRGRLHTVCRPGKFDRLPMWIEQSITCVGGVQIELDQFA